MKLDEIGIWSEIKLDIIKEYASAFTKIMRKQDWCKGYAYIDAFAGTGYRQQRKKEYKDKSLFEEYEQEESGEFLIAGVAEEVLHGGGVKVNEFS